MRSFLVLAMYRTAGNIGGQLNLVAWRLGKRPSNLNPSNLSAIYTTYVLFYACACAHIICTELPPNLNLPIFLFQPLGTKPPNLKITNISGYTVCPKLGDQSIFKASIKTACSVCTHMLLQSCISTRIVKCIHV